MISPHAFKKAHKEIGIGTWHGKYRGRNDHEGYGIDFETIPDFGRFMAALARRKKFDWLIEQRMHIDDMGHGIIVSWDRGYFTETKKDLDNPDQIWTGLI